MGKYKRKLWTMPESTEEEKALVMRALKVRRLKENRKVTLGEFRKRLVIEGAKRELAHDPSSV